jgi:hypothetical protein
MPIRGEIVTATLNRSYNLLNQNNHLDIHKQHEFLLQTVVADESLTEEELIEAVRTLNKIYDRNKITLNQGTRRTCENCNQECLATTYCDFVFEII